MINEKEHQNSKAKDMKLFFGKIVLYVILMFFVLEGATRLLHLNSEYPWFIINDHNIKTYAPNQTGYYTIGNRRMNFAQYHINKSGFNSYRDFNPTKDKEEVALLGDSFIEGLHQDYFNSIGEKVENALDNGTEVYEYGHSGYDLADVLYLMHTYEKKFELIDHIIIYLKFDNDLLRDTYAPDQYWVDSQYFLFSRIQRKSKFISYLKDIGFFEPLRNLKTTILSYVFPNEGNYDQTESSVLKTEEEKVNQYLNNFKVLMETYPIDKDKTVFLLDSTKTASAFLDYCKSNGYKYLDFSKELNDSKRPTTLVFDRHWNNNGRNIIARVIENYLLKVE